MHAIQEKLSEREKVASRKRLLEVSLSCLECLDVAEDIIQTAASGLSSSSTSFSASSGVKRAINKSSDSVVGHSLQRNRKNLRR